MEEGVPPTRARHAPPPKLGSDWRVRKNGPRLVQHTGGRDGRSCRLTLSSPPPSGGVRSLCRKGGECPRRGWPLRRSGAQRLIGVDAWLIWYLASDEALLGHKLQTQVAPNSAAGADVIQRKDIPVRRPLNPRRTGTP